MQPEALQKKCISMVVATCIRHYINLMQKAYSHADALFFFRQVEILQRLPPTSGTGTAGGLRLLVAFSLWHPSKRELHAKLLIFRIQC